MNKYLIIYFLIINTTAIILMGIDKRKAVMNRWRISEHTLLLIAFIGGGFGIFIAMKIFRHKINKPLFKYGIPLIILVYYLVVRILILNDTSILMRSINFFD